MVWTISKVINGKDTFGTYDQKLKTIIDVDSYDGCKYLQNIMRLIQPIIVETSSDTCIQKLDGITSL